MRALLLIAIGCGGNAATGPGDAVHADAAKASIDAMVSVVDADLDAPTDIPVVPCTAAPADVYAISTTTAAPGTILACAPDGTMTMADVQTAIGTQVTATTDVAMYRIAYATRTGGNAPAVSTARVYLPHTPRAKPVPLVAAAHGSVGLADSCAPSTGVDHNLPLPYAARGFATIAPDLAGLGNGGYQDYLDNKAQGRQLLDGARALRALLAPGLTADQLVLSGYSQGGGAALAAQQLIGSDGPGAGTLAATVVYAPEWPIRLNSFGYADILRDPSKATFSTGLSRSSIVVLRQWAFFENWIGPGHGPDAFATKYATDLKTNIDGQCLVAFGGYVQTSMTHTGDLIEDGLRQGLLACIDQSGACTGNAAAYYQAMVDNQLPIDPHQGPTLLVQGLADQIMAPASEAACIVAEMKTAGSDLDICSLATADHSNVMDQHFHGIAWLESVLSGGARAECDNAFPLPACAP